MTLAVDRQRDRHVAGTHRSGPLGLGITNAGDNGGGNGTDPDGLEEVAAGYFLCCAFCPSCPSRKNTPDPVDMCLPTSWRHQRRTFVPRLTRPVTNFAVRNRPGVAQLQIRRERRLCPWPAFCLRSTSCGYRTYCAANARTSERPEKGDLRCDVFHWLLLACSSWWLLHRPRLK